MNGKIIVSGIVAGIAMFAWGAISHMALGLCDNYVKNLPNDATVTSQLKNNITEPGFYFFPGMEKETTGMTKEAKEASFKTWSDKHQAGPTGVLIYSPTGSEPMSPKQFGTQFFIDVVIGIIVAILFAKMTTLIPTFLGRVLFVSTIGLIAGIAILLPYWNWYGFPTNFAIASIVDQVAAFTCAGIALAVMIKPTTTNAS